LGRQTILKFGWEAQGDLEEPLEEALEEEVGSLEGDFNSDFVHDLHLQQMMQGAATRRTGEARTRRIPNPAKIPIT